MSASTGNNDKKVSIAVIGGLAIGIAFVVIFSMVINENSSSTTKITTGIPAIFAANQEAMLQRGNIAMGFDQNKIMHHFMTTPTGGRIMIVVLDNNDSETIQDIKDHIIDIQDEFSQGNFTKPFFIHDQNVPGTDIMMKKKEMIRYSTEQLSNGAVLILTTDDEELKNAIQDFMRFQGMEHKGH